MNCKTQIGVTGVLRENPFPVPRWQVVKELLGVLGHKLGLKQKNDRTA